MLLSHEKASGSCSAKSCMQSERLLRTPFTTFVGWLLGSSPYTLVGLRLPAAFAGINDFVSSAVFPVASL